MTIQSFHGPVSERPPIQPLIELDAPVATDVLTQTEYEVFRDALPTWRDRLIAMLLRNSGIRVNELLSLEVRHCVLDGPSFIVYIRRSKKRNATTYQPIYINPGLGPGRVVHQDRDGQRRLSDERAMGGDLAQRRQGIAVLNSDEVPLLGVA